MADLKTRFDAAAEDAKKLAARPDNNTMLRLYALFKQATQGDAGGNRPGMFDPVGQAKYDAWAKLKGTNRDAAMQSYVDLVESLKK